jgi:hypothetical protein
VAQQPGPDERDDTYGADAKQAKDASVTKRESVISYVAAANAMAENSERMDALMTSCFSETSAKVLSLSNRANCINNWREKHRRAEQEQVSSDWWVRGCARTFRSAFEYSAMTALHGGNKHRQARA